MIRESWLIVGWGLWIVAAPWLSAPCDFYLIKSGFLRPPSYLFQRHPCLHIRDPRLSSRGRPSAPRGPMINQWMLRTLVYKERKSFGIYRNWKCIFSPITRKSMCLAIVPTTMTVQERWQLRTAFVASIIHYADARYQHQTKCVADLGLASCFAMWHHCGFSYNRFLWFFPRFFPRCLVFPMIVPASYNSVLSSDCWPRLVRDR